MIGVKLMSSLPDRKINPYQAPEEAIDFAEISDAEARSKAALRPRAVEALRETRPWVSLLGWVGLLMGGLGALGGVLGVVRALGTDEGRGLAVWLGFRLVLCIVYCVGSLFLLRYASLIGDLLVSGHPDHLDAALEAQKSFWKFVGMTFAILFLILIGAILILFLGGGISFFFR